MTHIYLFGLIIGRFLKEHRITVIIRNNAGFGSKKMRDIRNGRIYDETYIRLWMALAQVLTTEEFMRYIMRIARLLYRFAEYHGDEYLKKARMRARK